MRARINSENICENVCAKLKMKCVESQLSFDEQLSIYILNPSAPTPFKQQMDHLLNEAILADIARQKADEQLIFLMRELAFQQEALLKNPIKTPEDPNATGSLIPKRESDFLRFEFTVVMVMIVVSELIKRLDACIAVLQEREQKLSREVRQAEVTLNLTIHDIMRSFTGVRCGEVDLGAIDISHVLRGIADGEVAVDDHFPVAEPSVVRIVEPVREVKSAVENAPETVHVLPVLTPIMPTAREFLSNFIHHYMKVSGRIDPDGQVKKEVCDAFHKKIASCAENLVHQGRDLRTVRADYQDAVRNLREAREFRNRCNRHAAHPENLHPNELIETTQFLNKQQNNVVDKRPQPRP